MQELEPDLEQPIRLPVYTCDCGFSTEYRQSLKVHIRSHDGDVEYTVERKDVTQIRLRYRVLKRKPRGNARVRRAMFMTPDEKLAMSSDDNLQKLAEAAVAAARMAVRDTASDKFSSAKTTASSATAASLASTETAAIKNGAIERLESGIDLEIARRTIQMAHLWFFHDYTFQLSRVGFYSIS